MSTLQDSLPPRAMQVVLLATLLSLVSAFNALADGGIVFTDITSDPATGLEYQRAPSATAAVMDALRQQSLIEPIDPAVLPTLPYNSSGQPGIAIFDYDGDGDLDLYVTNGPGAANSLFSNQLVETGELKFIDRAEEAGVAASAQDGMGVCYGDTDNDGDDDLLVLGRDEPNRFFENLGDGSFVEVLDSALAGGSLSSPSCSLGDINGDGLLDVLVGNAYDHGNLLACLVEPFGLTQHNQLFLNLGDNEFSEISTTSGIQELTGFVPETEGAAGITWAVAMVDLDLDGDTDLVFGDDQCGMQEIMYGGMVDRGYLHMLINDGTGQFTDVPMLDGPFPSSSWMGLGFGDLDCDGTMDVFGSNFGDYNDMATNTPYVFGQQATRPVFGNGDGTFSDRGVGAVGASVFGWGNGVLDYDNDGDQDVVYHGGLDFAVTVPADNPGVLLQNQGCSGDFAYDAAAFLTDHRRRIVQGVALGDLDRNGFVDIVTASSFDLPESVPLVSGPAEWGTPFDGLAVVGITWDFTADGLVWRGVDRLPGSLSVELSDGANGNGSATLRTVGSVGLTDGGQVNRNGIGAVVSFTPEDGETVLMPVQGGSSFASQHSLELTFGLGSATRGRVEVLWPGGVRNRLHGVGAGEHLVLPEIPCSYTDEWPNRGAFLSCVAESLRDLRQQGILGFRLAKRHFFSMRAAYNEVHGAPPSGPLSGIQ